MIGWTSIQARVSLMLWKPSDCPIGRGHGFILGFRRTAPLRMYRTVTYEARGVLYDSCPRSFALTDDRCMHHDAIEQVWDDWCDDFETGYEGVMLSVGRRGKRRRRRTRRERNRGRHARPPHHVANKAARLLGLLIYRSTRYIE